MSVMDFIKGEFVEVVEWSLRAHDGTRLWGLKGQSSFHPEPKAVWLREFDSADQPEVPAKPADDTSTTALTVVEAKSR
jgi:hypothetical protein